MFKLIEIVEPEVQDIINTIKEGTTVSLYNPQDAIEMLLRAHDQGIHIKIVDTEESFDLSLA